MTMSVYNFVMLVGIPRDQKLYAQGFGQDCLSRRANTNLKSLLTFSSTQFP